MSSEKHFNNHFFQHTQLQIRSFYSRFTHNPWRPVVLFCGDLDFAPYSAPDKKIFLASDQESCLMHGTEGFKILIEDFQELPFFDGGVDTLICYFNKTLPQESILYEFYRVLSPRGKLILTINNRHSCYYFLKDSKLSDPIHVTEQLLEHYDFTIISKVAHSFYPPLSSAYLVSKVLKANKFLRKYLKSFANQQSFICIKKHEPYQLLPSYARLTQQISVNWGA